MKLNFYFLFRDLDSKTLLKIPNFCFKNEICLEISKIYLDQFIKSKNEKNKFLIKCYFYYLNYYNLKAL